MSNRGRILTLSLAILGTLTCPTFAARWTEANTGMPGFVPGVRTLYIDRGSGSTLYALTTAQSLFRGTDGGASWKSLGSITGVQILAVDPATPLTIYAGTLHGVFRSIDGGESWNATGLSGSIITVLAVDPVTPSIVYAGGDGDRIYKSTDAGANWTAYAIGLPAVPGPGPGVSSLLLDPTNPATIYLIARALGSPLYKSTDGGESWNVIDAGPFGTLFAIAASSPPTLYAIRFRTGLSKSTDGGASWTGLGFTQSIVAFAVDPTNANVLYASTSDGQGIRHDQSIYKSVDGGANWNLMATMPLAVSFALSPDASSVYAASPVGGVLRSTDAGRNWTASNSGLRIFGIQTLVVDPMDPATIYAGGDDGLLFKSTDSGTNWIQRAAFQIVLGATPGPPGLPPPPSFMPPFSPVAPGSVDSLLIDYTNPNILYVGTHRTDGCFFGDVLLFKSTDGGDTWSDSISPMGSGCLADALLAMDPTDPNILYLRYGEFFDGFGLMKTTDGGAHWNGVGLGADEESALVIDPTASSILYAATDSGVVKSIDGGAKWNATGLAKTNVNLLAIDPQQPGVLYAGTVAGLLKSADGGANWSPINTGLEGFLQTGAPFTALLVDPGHPQTLYAATSGSGIFKSTDGGATWAAYSDGLTQLDVRILAISRGGTAIVYAGTPGGVFKIVEDAN